jgi:hypothetical protein
MKQFYFIFNVRYEMDKYLSRELSKYIELILFRFVSDFDDDITLSYNNIGFIQEI